MTPYSATIYALGEAAVNLDIDINLNRILFRWRQGSGRLVDEGHPGVCDT